MEILDEAWATTNTGMFRATIAMDATDALMVRRDEKWRGKTWKQAGDRGDKESSFVTSCRSRVDKKATAQLWLKTGLHCLYLMDKT